VIARQTAVLLLVTAATIAGAGSGGPEPRDFLRTVIGFGEDKLAAVDRGEVVTRQLEALDKPESVAFGIVRLGVGADVFLERARDVPGFRRIPQTLETGVFHDPPRVEDLDGLTIPDGDFDDIHKCKQGDCDVMLFADLNARFQSEVNWTQPGARARAAAIIKDSMVAYVKSYLAEGTAMMPVLNDRIPATRLSEEFHTILERSPYFIDYIPEFFKYIEEYPKGTLEGAEDCIYWSKDNFGLKPVITINHVTIYADGGQHLEKVIVATKEVYASHYFRTSLEVDVAVPGHDLRGQPALYLISLKRARVNPPGGVAGGVLLGKVRGAVEKGIGLRLKAIKSKLDSAS
jgi:hypothetical protein